MILVTTTPSVDGYTITNYQGIVFGEVVSGVNMFKDLGAGLRNMFGGRSQGYEEELMRARNEAIAEMQQRAEAMGAHAVVGVDIDYEVLGADNGMLMVPRPAPPCRSRVRPENTHELRACGWSAGLPARFANLQRANNQINRHDVAGVPDDRA